MVSAARAAVVLTLIATLYGAPPAAAHVGSPNVFFDGIAGPYAVRVIIRPPGVVPGLAEIVVRLQEPAETVSVRLFRWDVGEEGAPPAEPAARVPGNDELFSAELWLMTAGAHSVEVSVQGPAGAGIALVPFESIRRETLEMGSWYAAMLVAMGLFLFVGAVSLCGVSVREMEWTRMSGGDVVDASPPPWPLSSLPSCFGRGGTGGAALTRHIGRPSSRRYRP